MDQAFDVGLSSWSLGQNGPVLRRPFRRHTLRHADFEDRYDFQTVFYDCFRSADGKHVYLIGPPLQNLEQDLGLRFFAMPSGTELVATSLPRVFISILVLAAPPDLQALRIESAAGTSFIVPQPNLSSLFDGRRVLMTLSQNNEPEWIRDWVIYHQRLHGCDAALVYDNNSTRYDLSELKDCLAGIPGVTGLAISWPFRYGPFDGRLPLTYDLWEGHFCQFGMLEHARFRFLSDARCALNLDIDELVICPDGDSICRHTETSGTGFLKFGGKWVEPFRSAGDTSSGKPLHRQFRHRRKGFTQGCENKYTVVPSRVPEAAQFGIHDIFGHTESRLPDGVELRHFKAINTNWTVDRPGTLQARTDQGFDAGQLQEDALLSSFLDKAFENIPEALQRTWHPDAETRLYQARLRSGLHLRNQRIEAAEREIRDALAANPGWPSLRLYHADLLARSGATAKADAERRHALRDQESDAASSYERGRYLLHTGDWAGAARRLRQALRQDPGFAPAYLALGRGYRSAGRQRTAERIIRRGIERAPASAQLHGALADLLLGANRPPAALEQADKALQLQPDNTRALLVRSRALRAMGRLEEALAAASRAVDLLSDKAFLMTQIGLAIDRPFEFPFPEDPLTADFECLRCQLQLERLPEAERLSHTMLAKYADRAQAHEARYLLLEAQRQPERAANHLSDAIHLAQRDLEKQPPQTLGRYNELEWHESRVRYLHFLLHCAHREDDARRLVDRELELHPGSNIVALQVQDLLSLRAPRADIRARLVTALRRSPRDHRLWEQNGRFLEQDGDRAGAIAAYRKALQHGPAQAWLLSHLAYLMLEQFPEQQDKLDEAETLLRAALKLNSTDALAHYRLGSLLWRRQSKDAAIGAWRTAARLSPKEAWLWSHLGGHLVDEGHLDEAADALERAATLRPDDALTEYRLCRLREKEGKLDAAVSHMSRAVTFETEKAWMWRHFSRLLEKAGRAEEAARAAERARQLG